MDDAHHLSFRVGIVDGCQQVGESHDGVEGCADFVGHVGQEHRLQSCGVVGTFCLAFQLILFRHELGDVTPQSEAACLLSLFVVFGHGVYLYPYMVLLVCEDRVCLSCPCDRFREVFLGAGKYFHHGVVLVYELFLQLFKGAAVGDGTQALIVFDGAFLEVNAPGLHLAGLHHVVQLHLVVHDELVGLLDVDVVLLGLQV